jgi:hypothetical protein
MLILELSNNNLSVYYLNIRGLTNKTDALPIIVKNVNSPHILCLTATLMKLPEIL